MISFNKTTFHYSKDSGIYEIDLKINSNEFCFLLGSTGSGKSTLMKLLYFDLFPTNGEVEIFGHSSNKINQKNVYKVRRDLGIIFQDYKLIKQRSVFDNIALPLRIRGESRGVIKDLVDEAIELTELKGLENKFPLQLSGGEQQRVCIARAIVKSPKLILADEPTGNLDPASGYRILKILEQIHAEGTAVIMATHNYKLISEKDYRIIELKKGRIVSS
jgi:cell division transport system ATP-binding protein